MRPEDKKQPVVVDTEDMQIKAAIEAAIDNWGIDDFDALSFDVDDD